jgi:hypothetical protein
MSLTDLTAMQTSKTMMEGKKQKGTVVDRIQQIKNILIMD